MKPQIVASLVCPTCSSSLRLEAFATGDGSDRVRDGVLVCDGCGTWYPVASYVPVLVDFATPFHDRFAHDHAAQLERVAGRTPPRGAPRPGEESVQRTFTEEWAVVSESELSFTYTIDELTDVVRHAWLPWAAHTPPRERVLDVGCGLGGEALALRGALPDAELFAVDLNFALLERAPDHAHLDRLHFVIASLFALPFPTASFDLVFSQGVLHHTYATRDALEEIALRVAPGGYLFVWVYGREDHLGLRGRRAVATRAGLALERLVRPAVARAPASVRRAFFRAATPLAHRVLKPRMRHAERWQPENTENYLRDWLSPPYAHRHGWNELIEWFEDLGFEVVATQSPRAYRELVGDRLWGVGLTGRKREDAPPRVGASAPAVRPRGRRGRGGARARRPPR